MSKPDSGRILIIANPTAGVGTGAPDRNRLLDVARRELQRDETTVEISLEVDRDAVVARAAAAAGEPWTAIVAAGGDGTINAVVNGLMQHTDTPLPPLGVLPMGTGNVFAFNMGISGWREASRVIRAGHTRAIDVGWADAPDGSNLQHFLLMAGVGFDAQVVENTSLRLKYVLRDFAYVLKTLENVVLHEGAEMTLQFEGGKELSGNFWQVMVGNVASYAWSIKVTQNARLDDGFIDVCAMPYRNKAVSFQQAMQILTGQHVARGVAKYVKTKGVLISSKEAVPVQLDGDEWGHTPVKLGIRPAALQVLAPQPENELRA